MKLTDQELTEIRQLAAAKEPTACSVRLLGHIDALNDVVWAQEQLLTAYRLGRQPPNRALNILAAWRDAEVKQRG